MLGGELIDVSVPHRYDTGVPHYFEHVDHNVSDYHIKSSTNDFIFKAPSLTYLIEDIEKILFIDQMYPWDDTKYGKRIKRLLFMYFCMLLINVNLNYEEKIRYLTYIKDGIFTKLIKMLVLNEPNYNDIMENINMFLEKSKINASSSAFPFRVLLEHLSKLLKNKEYDVKKFQEYCQLVYENINVLIGLFNTMLKQCDKKGINVNDITQGSILWGGDMNKHKYLKYKNKYLKLKNNH
jgi:hypothetical protein